VSEDESVSNGRHNVVLSDLQVTAWRFVSAVKGGSYGNIVVGKMKKVELPCPRHEVVSGGGEV
jgi:hypothetical protein